MEIALIIDQTNPGRRNEGIPGIGIVQRIGCKEIGKDRQNPQYEDDQPTDNGRFAASEAPPDQLKIALALLDSSDSAGVPNFG